MNAESNDAAKPMRDGARRLNVATARNTAAGFDWESWPRIQPASVPPNGATTSASVANPAPLLTITHDPGDSSSLRTRIPTTPATDADSASPATTGTPPTPSEADGTDGADTGAYAELWSLVGCAMRWYPMAGQPSNIPHP